MAVRRNQTLKPRWFHILLALSDQDRHGSDIVREVLEQTDGELQLWPAMLYGSLEQMAVSMQPFLLLITGNIVSH